QDRPEEARKHFIEARDLAREIDLPGEIVLGGAHLSLLDEGEIAAAREDLQTWSDRLRADEKMEVCFLLHQASGDPADLEEAHRLLSFIRDHTPEKYRETLTTNVPLNRDILTTWERTAEGA
ncbi:MAG: hypothetical protein ACYS99_12135, partial [Planctomycetota bacterium]